MQSYSPCNAWTARTCSMPSLRRVLTLHGSPLEAPQVRESTAHCGYPLGAAEVILRLPVVTGSPLYLLAWALRALTRMAVSFVSSCSTLGRLSRETGSPGCRAAQPRRCRGRCAPDPANSPGQQAPHAQQQAWSGGPRAPQRRGHWAEMKATTIQLYPVPSAMLTAVMLREGPG